MIPTAPRRTATTSRSRLREAVALPTPARMAEASLRNFQTYGAGAAEDVQKTLDLISDIVKAATP